MLTPITTAGRVVRPLTPPASAWGRLPAFDWVPVEALRSDDGYQRPLAEGNWRVIQRIADDFDWSRFSPLLVAPIDGGLYAIIDGQHRAHAARLRAISHVPAMIVDLDPAGQAAAFAAVNGTVTRITPFHLLRAALAAGDEWAVQARAAVQAAGCILRTANNTSSLKKPLEVYSVALIRGHVQKGRGPVVTRALSALAHCPLARESAAWWVEPVLSAWITLVGEYPDLSRDALADFADGARLPVIVGNAAALRHEPQFRGASAREIALQGLRVMLSRETSGRRRR